MIDRAWITALYCAAVVKVTIKIVIKYIQKPNSNTDKVVCLVSSGN